MISKISPLVGNLIEMEVVRALNRLDWKGQGKWARQDPGFPDTVFRGKVSPQPGVEIKTWFPFATEITARFKDSQTFFAQNQTNVAVLAWIPEFIIYGRPRIIGVWVGSGAELAASRDNHYHNPPDYLVTEPEDTTSRTANLQQTNVNGLKFQGTPDQWTQAKAEVAAWGPDKRRYSPLPEYQALLRRLQGKYRYRLDTNFAKMDRVVHDSLEVFKEKTLNTVLDGATIKSWPGILASDTARMAKLLDLVQKEGTEIPAGMLSAPTPPDTPRR
jgi:hypothetical protein